MKKYIYTSTIAVLLSLVLITCKKAPEIENNTNKKALPVVVTLDVVNVTATTACCGGNVTDDGNSIVTEKGVCWSTNENPTIDDRKTIVGSGLGAFNIDLDDLEDGKTYYVRAYAINEKGASYGSIKNFVTLKITLPALTTITPTNIQANSAISGGNITDEGNSAITARGVCYDISENPTLDNNLGYTSDGSGAGSFTSNITGLINNTTYYVVAYATNEKGTSYGQSKSFIAQDPCGQLTISYGGQECHTVQIGAQCWIKENLNIGTKINSTSNMSNNSIIEKYCYDNIESNCNQYGGLYQWDEMMQYTTQEGAQGICPGGWHIPTDDEWKNMEMALGMSQSQTDNTDYRGTDQGEQMKSTSGWAESGNGTNSSGFNALPGGLRHSSGSFYNLGYYGYWWSTTEYSGTYAWLRSLYYDSGQVGRSYNRKTYGFSVRCIKN